MSADIPPPAHDFHTENDALSHNNDLNRRLASFPMLNPNPVLEVDRTGSLVYANPAALAILAEAGAAGAGSFLPADFGAFNRSPSSDENRILLRTVDFGSRCFEERINFTPQYDTFRIYAMDVTGRRQTEEALKQSEEKYRTLYETMSQGVLYFDPSMHILSANPAVTRILGVTADPSNQDPLSDPFWNAIREDGSSFPVDQCPAMLAMRTGEPVTDVPMGIYNPAFGGYVWVVVSAMPLYLPESDKPFQVYCTIEDNTGRKKTEQALRESETRFRLLLKNSPVTVAAQDTDLRFTWAYNQRTVDPNSIIGRTDAEIFPPQTAGWLMDLKRRVLQSGEEVREQGWVSSGGKQLYLDLYLEPMRNQSGQIMGVGTATVDLTNVKLAEQALRASEERYRSLFTGMEEGFAFHELIYDAAGQPADYRFLDLNPAFERLTGLKRDQVIGKTYRQVLPGEGDSWVNIYGKVVTTGESIQFEQFSSTLNRYYQVYAYRSAPHQFAVIFMDVSRQKNIENELRVNLAKYTTLFDSLPLGVTVSDHTGQILESNKEAALLLGLTVDEHKGRQIDGAEWQIVRPDRTPMPAEEFASVRALKEHRRIENVEMGIVKGGGEISWISVTAAPLPIENYGVVIAYNDITRRMQAEEALRKAHDDLEQIVLQRTHELLAANTSLLAEIEERKRVESALIVQTRAVEAERKRFNEVLEILPAYLILLTPDYHVAFANRYFRQRFGEDQGRRCYEYLFGRTEPCPNCETYKVLADQADHNWEWTGPDGRQYDVFDYPFSDVDGSILILEMGIDITQRKLAEEKLRLLNAYNRTLLEAAMDPLVTITSEGKIGDVNASTEAVTGYTRSELVGTDFSSYFTDPEKARAGYLQVFESGKVQDYELAIEHKSGHITPVLYNATVFRDGSGTVAGVFAAARDITERKLAERQLLLLNSALEAAANGIIIVDKEGSILWSNPAFSQMTGYPREQIVGLNPRILKSGKQNLKFYRNLWDTILGGGVWRGEIINRKMDGSLYNEEQTITPVFGNTGEITNFISIRQDITEQKKADEALRKSEEQYRSLIIATAQIVWQTDAQGAMLPDNAMWGIFTGQNTEEYCGSGWMTALHPSDQARVGELWDSAVKAGSIFYAEYQVKNHAGEYSYFSTRAVPIKNAAGDLISWIGACTDITEKKRFEAQLILAEKHAVIGRMVGSVTHELNNPLQTIKNCLYLIRQDTVTGSPNEEPLEMALSETIRLSNLVGQLRQLYRPASSQNMHPNELLEVIQEVHSLITPHLNNSRVLWQSMPGLTPCFVNCVREQIVEVFLNICMNAVEAMQPSGGTLAVDMNFSAGRDQVGVVIQDSGPGISPEILPHIFEPFVTTKVYGMGLGLSISYGIIQKHSGRIMVDSLPGQGTKFTIWLPLVLSTPLKGDGD